MVAPKPYEMRPLPTELGVEILRTEVGSTLHGISIGNDDRDEMGVCIEPPEFVIGLRHFEQYIYRSAVEREGLHDAPSRPGDLDLVVYSLRKWARLALKGNPNVLSILFTDRCVVRTPLGGELQRMRSAFASRAAGSAFLGYLTAQKQRYLRERGRGNMPQRGDGDRKYLAHMLRLGFQGRELLSTGFITLPMPEDEREFVRAARRGDIDPNEILTRAGELEREVADLTRGGSPLDEKPDTEAVNEFLLRAYISTWARL